jgi:hypothetical protein
LILVSTKWRGTTVAVVVVAGAVDVVVEEEEEVVEVEVRIPISNGYFWHKTDSPSGFSGSNNAPIRNNRW